MKRLPIVLLVLGATLGSASAATPEEDYLAARDAYIKTFTHGAHDDSSDKAHQRALDDLQAKLRRIIGPVSIKVFPREGAINLEALDQGDGGFGRLDGIVYGADPDKQRVLVTTTGLLDTWLKTHRDQWTHSTLPPDIGAALKHDDFYSQALSTDAAFVSYAEIPVKKPAWATHAVALLNTHTQDTAPPFATEMTVAVRSNDRLFVVMTQTTIKAGPIATCDEEHARLAKQAEAASDADQKAGGKDPALHDKAEQLARKADGVYPGCFATNAPNAGFFPALVKQAQALVDALPSK
jgi:hypothetical protein